MCRFLLGTMKSSFSFIVISLAISLIFSSCGFIAPREMKRNFKYCYDGKNTGIDSLINIHGYYSMGQLCDRYGINSEKEHVIDTFFCKLYVLS
jgi:hypothetical protein